jgi:hypothetical protein
MQSRLGREPVAEDEAKLLPLVLQSDLSRVVYDPIEVEED